MISGGEVSSGRNQRSHSLSGDHAFDVAGYVEIEDHNGQIVFLAERDGRGIHYAQAALQHVEIGDGFDHGSRGHEFGIGIVDAVDLGGFHNDVGLDLHGAQRSRGIGREIGIAGSAAKDDHPAFFQMPQGAAANERFRHLVHFQRGHNTGEHTLLFEGILQSERVDHGGQHAHVVGGNAVHIAGLLGHAAKEVSSAYYNGDLRPQFVNFSDFARNLVNTAGFNPKTFVASQGLTGKFEQDTFESKLHVVSVYRVIRALL